jgi:hypothetical protein
LLIDPDSEFADLFPGAEVIGTDLSPVQPAWVPPNLRFEIDDAALDWTWDDNQFDFIHIRYIFGSIKNWDALLAQAYRCCAPGGWVQSGECDVEFRSDDGTVELEPVLAKYGNLFREGGKIMDRPFFVRELQEEAFNKAGFVDQQKVIYKVCRDNAPHSTVSSLTDIPTQIPIGGWPKDPKLAEVGRFVKATLENDLEGETVSFYHN